MNENIKVKTVYTFLIPQKDLSWELSKKFENYIKKADIRIVSEGIEVSVSDNQILSDSAIKHITENIPVWINEVSKENISKNKKHSNKVKKFLQTYKIPSIDKKDANKKVLADLIDVMQNYLKDVENDQDKEPDMAACAAADLEDISEIFEAVAKDKIKKVKKLKRDLDTSVRESLPASLIELIDLDEFEKE